MKHYIALYLLVFLCSQSLVFSLDYAYEGDLHPLDVPAPDGEHSINSSFSSLYTSSNGVLRVETSDISSNLFNGRAINFALTQSNAFAAGNNNQFTIDFRIAGSTTGLKRQLPQLDFFTQDLGRAGVILGNQTNFNDNSLDVITLSTGGTLKLAGLDTTQFNTYRIAGNGNTYRLWVNDLGQDNFVFEGTFLAVNPADGRIGTVEYGLEMDVEASQDGSNSGFLDIDFFRINQNQSAINVVLDASLESVPEPSTYLLFLLGLGICVCRRQNSL